MLLYYVACIMPSIAPNGVACCVKSYVVLFMLSCHSDFSYSSQSHKI